MTKGTAPAAELVWFKSSYSGSNTTECVEAAATPAHIHLRDSKRPSGARIAFEHAAWTTFVEAMDSGRLS